MSRRVKYILTLRRVDHRGDGPGSQYVGIEDERALGAVLANRATKFIEDSAPFDPQPGDKVQPLWGSRRGRAAYTVVGRSGEFVWATKGDDVYLTFRVGDLKAAT